MDDTTDELFCDLMELPPDERVRTLDAMTDISPGRRDAVLRMLADAEGAEEYFTGTSAAVKMLPLPSRIERKGDMCGPYTLVRKLGEGGFGVVWLAEQEMPLRRSVAVKVIKAGMDSDEVLARFEAEKQAIARMEHPNIAKVLDAGMTEHGRPFFVMELVEGNPITRHCEESGMDLRGRLKLFADVCSALSHAHQKGVIHRDIKPSNVIVTEIDSKPVAKVIDFGIAKAIDGQLTDHTLRTRAEQWIGTPAYMSPEQAGLTPADPDTRSDIYTLGVLLYELIAGVAPFDSATLMKAGYEEMRRIIREDEPPRPSVRMMTSSRKAAGHPDVKPSMPGSASSELDWIVMKAMEKTKERRYESAASLAADVARYLADEPLEARPPGSWYLFGKFARRHRVAVRSFLAFAIILVAAVALSSWQALRARSAETLAENRLREAILERNAKDAALEDAQAVSRLLSEVFRRPDPDVDGRKVTVVEALDAASAKLDKELKDQPERHAMLLEVLAETYEKLGIMQKSIELRRKALNILKARGETSLHEFLKASSLLVSRLGYVGSYEDARDLAAEEFSLREKHFGLDDMTTLQSLESHALNAFRSGQYPKAIGLQEKLVRAMGNILPNDDPRLTEAKMQLFGFCRNSGDKRRALRLNQELGREAVISQAESRGDRHKNLQSTLRQNQEALAQLERDLGDKSTRTIDARAELASILVELARSDEALEIQMQVLADSKEVYGDSHPKTLLAMDQCRHYAGMAQQWDIANRMIREATEIRVGTFGMNHYDSLRFHGGRMLNMVFLKQADEGLRLGDEYLPQIRQVMGPHSRAYYNYYCNYARCLAAAGRSREALPVLAECCPNMLDDTFVNLLYAGLSLWHGQEDDYERTRSLMMGYAKSLRTRAKQYSYQLDKNILICSLMPLKTQDQNRELATTLARAEAITDSKDYRSKLWHGPTWSKTIQGVASYRIGNLELALKRFDEAQQPEAAAKSDTADWEQKMIAIHRPLVLNAMGSTGEAKRMFLENTKSLLLWTDQDEPLRGSTGADGRELPVYLSYREALKTFEMDPPK